MNAGIFDDDFVPACCETHLSRYTHICTWTWLNRIETWFKIGVSAVSHGSDLAIVAHTYISTILFLWLQAAVVPAL